MTDHTTKVFTASLEAMQALLKEATLHVDEALKYCRQGNRNAARGSMPATDELLSQALALYTAACTLHARARDA